MSSGERSWANSLRYIGGEYTYGPNAPDPGAECTCTPDAEPVKLRGSAGRSSLTFDGRHHPRTLPRCTRRCWRPAPTGPGWASSRPWSTWSRASCRPGPSIPPSTCGFSLIDHPPSSGTIFLECHPAKVGPAPVRRRDDHAHRRRRTTLRPLDGHVHEPTDGPRGGLQCAAGRTRSARASFDDLLRPPEAGCRARSRWIRIRGSATARRERSRAARRRCSPRSRPSRRFYHGSSRRSTSTSAS